MCNCDKPNINGQFGYKWNDNNEHTRSVHPPETLDDDKILYDLPGRCGGIDSHSYHFTVVERETFGRKTILLLVRHGGGDESFDIGSSQRVYNSGLIEAINNAADDNARYWLSLTLYRSMSQLKIGSIDKERRIWKRAAAEGRLKIRSRKGNKYAEILPEKI